MEAAAWLCIGIGAYAIAMFVLLMFIAGASKASSHDDVREETYFSPESKALEQARARAMLELDSRFRRRQSEASRHDDWNSGAA